MATETFPKLTYLKYDKLSLIKQELDETKVIMLDSIDKLLERQTALDELINRSENLKVEAIKFHREGKNLNRCCTII